MLISTIILVTSMFPEGEMKHLAVESISLMNEKPNTTDKTDSGIV